MDFSSIPRALESLLRRQPPLDARALEVAALLGENKDVSGEEFLGRVVVLLTVSERVQDNTSELRRSIGRWEPLAVGLYVCTEALQQQMARFEAEQDGAPAAGKGIVYMEGPRVPSIVEDTSDIAEGTPASAVPSVESWKSPELSTEQILSLCETLHVVSLEHLEDSEPRVRTLVAKAAGVYCKLTLLLKQGDSLRKEVHERVVSSIQDHLKQGRQQAEHAEGKYSKSSTGALDDTTGWRALETNWHCLAAIISSMGSYYFDDFGYFSDSFLQDLLHSCVVHVNRHVRAAGLAVLEQCVTAALPSNIHSDVLLRNTQSTFAKTVLAAVHDGLADNWSQVRMAASVLTRVYLAALQKLSVDLDPLFPVILPRMCLNRFYMAQGVKLYSHETWKMIFQTGGIGYVAEHLPAVCRYYVKMCDANNHAVREAACQAIAELAVRLGDIEEYRPKFQQQVPILMQALLMCFHDESWPVRDEACLACGILCRSYPEECRSELKTLWERWTEQLTDQIWSVREDAAVALGDALEAYGQEFYLKIKAFLKEQLPSAKRQAPMTMSEYKARQNDEGAHTNSQLFSCGSLAPKLHKRKDGAGRIGCSSCDITKERELWQATDGCIYLVRELVVRCAPEDAALKLSDAEIQEWLRNMVDVCRVQHFPQADDMRATLWRQVPLMAQALGKERFKRNGYLEIFCDLLFDVLDSRSASQLCQHAAGQCAEELANFIGVPIFRGRLEDHQRQTLDRVMRERQAMPKGPIMDAGFSPFGPPGLLDAVGKHTTPAFLGRV